MSGFPEEARENCALNIDYCEGDLADLVERSKSITDGIIERVSTYQSALSAYANKVSELAESIRDEPTHEGIREFGALVDAMLGVVVDLSDEMRDMGAKDALHGPVGCVRESLYDVDYIAESLKKISAAVEDGGVGKEG